MGEYCLYLRKSRLDLEAEAHGEGDTLARHRAALLKLAHTRNLPVTGCYEEVCSGESIAARPEMQRLLNDVEAGLWCGVLVMEVERLARGNTTDQGMVADTFKYSGTRIITPAKDYDPADEFDEEYFEFGLFMSRREYKTINRRLQRGRRASLAEGKYIAGKAAYGYERYKLPGEKGYSLRIIPEQAEVVRQIFDWYVNGEEQPDGSLRPLGSFTIAKRLDACGVPAPSGGKWPACTVQAILANPTYIGKVRWSYRPTVKRMVDGAVISSRPVNHDVPLSDGRHAPILEEPLYNRAQDILNSRSHPPVPRAVPLQNPLAGLVVCGTCGRTLERRRYARGQDCMVCPNRDCDTKGSVLETVERAILDALASWLSGYQLQLEPLPSDRADPGAEKTVVFLQRSLDGLQTQMDRLCDLVEQGVYTPQRFLQRSQALSARMAALDRALLEARAHQAASRRLTGSRFPIVPRVAHVLEAYPTLADPGAKNALLKEIVDKVIYSKTRGGRWVSSDMRLLLFPRIERLEERPAVRSPMP